MISTPREETIRQSNLSTLISTRNTLSTSLGPYGLDKMIINDKVVVTNDGCTILSEINKRNKNSDEENAVHPLNDMILSLSTHQDKIAGDGTTSVVVVTSSLFEKGCELINEGVPRAVVIREMEKLKSDVSNWIIQNRIPLITDNNESNLQTISNSQPILKKPVSSKLENQENNHISHQIDLTNKSHQYAFHHAVKTSLSSKILSSVIDTVVPIAIQTLKYKKILHVKVLGDGMENSKLLQGVVFHLKEKQSLNDSVCIEKENFYDSSSNSQNFLKRIALLQYPLSAPKPNIDSKIEISSNIDRIIKEEKEYVFEKIKELKKHKIDFVFVQKNILRESVSDLSDYFLKRLNMSYAVLERNELELLSDEMNIEKSVEGKVHVETVDLRCFEGMVRIVQKIALNDSQKIVKNKNHDNNNKILVKIENGKENVAQINDFSEDQAQTRNEDIDQKDKISGIKKENEIRYNAIASLILTGSDQTILDESSRSFNDAIMVVNSLYEEPFIVAGGGSVEINLIKSKRESIIQQKIINGLEIIPFYLCKNAGLNYFKIKDHSSENHKVNNNDSKDQKIYFNQKDYDTAKGIDLVNGEIVDLVQKGVIIPSRVVRTYLELGLETAAFLLSIDDILPSRV